MLSAGIDGLFVRPYSSSSKANTPLRLIFLYPSLIAYIITSSVHFLKMYRISRARAKQYSSSLSEEESLYQLGDVDTESSSSSSGNAVIQLGRIENETEENEEEEEERISFDLSIFLPENSPSGQPDIATVASSFTQQATSRFDRHIIGCVLLGNFILGTISVFVPRLNMVFSSVALACSHFMFVRRKFLPPRLSFLVDTSYATGCAASFLMLLYPVRLFISGKGPKKTWRIVYLSLTRPVAVLYLIISFVCMVFILAYSKLKRNKKFELQNIAIAQSPHLLKAVLITNLALNGLSMLVPWAIPFIAFQCIVFLCMIKSSFPTLLRLIKWAISAGSCASFLALFVLKECMDVAFNFKKALKTDLKYILLLCYIFYIVFIALYTVVMLFAIHISFAEQAYVRKVMLPAMQDDIAADNDININRDNE